MFSPEIWNSPASEAEKTPPFSFADRTKGMQGSAIRELLKISPDTISFGGGYPAIETFSEKLIRSLEKEALEIFGPGIFQYGRTEGFVPFLEAAASYLREDIGVSVSSADEVRVTTGSQQALDLLGKIFINQGDCVAVTRPVYLGALQAFNPYGPKYIEMETDEHGVIPQSLDEVLTNYNIKLIYAVPTFDNPTGRTIPIERRKEIAQIIKSAATISGHIVPFIEDDPYSQVRFCGKPIRPIQRFAPENVIYLTTYSKTLFPSARIGLVRAPEDVLEKLVLAKQGADLCTSTYLQALAAVYHMNGYIDKHLPYIQDLYLARRNEMIYALNRCFPEEYTWTIPEGGLFIWVEGPEHVDMKKVLEEAKKQKVAFVPGEPFYATPGQGKNAMRLNFSSRDEEDINKGISILGKILHQYQ